MADNVTCKEGATLSTTVGIIGTGIFARGLATRLVTYNYTVVFGSRHPKQLDALKKTDEIFNNENILIKSITECIQSSELIFLCIHQEHHKTMDQYGEILENKTLIDVSNASKTPNKKEPSIAETLSKLLPQTNVVKGFNSLSGYALANESAGESKVVYVCGNDPVSREGVLGLARSCGFIGVDRGSLASAKELESMSHDLCSQWSGALLITLVVSAAWFTYTMWRYYAYRHHPYSWENFPMHVMNKFYGEVGIMLLALCYLPGCIAAFIQMAHGTKNIRFPNCLDTWLKSRKYLGLLALLFSALHVTMSIILLNAQYFPPFFNYNSQTVEVNRTKDTKVRIDSQMNWMGETSIHCGLAGITLMIIIGITSIPAVGNLLNWRQWNFIQSHLGFFCLFLSTAHVTVRGAYKWVDQDFSIYVISMTFLGSFLPWWVLFFKIILYLPCVNSYVMNIRKGWERNKSKVDVENANIGNSNLAYVCTEL